LTPQDASLLFSNASALRPALPFAFITSDNNYVPAYTLHLTALPAGIEIAKYYYKKHVEDITNELNAALALGPAASEEWSKGLQDRGDDRMKCAENWERWELKFQPWAENEKKPASAAAPSPASASHKELSRSPAHRAMSPMIHAPVPASKYLFFSAAAAHDGTQTHAIQTPPVTSLTNTATAPMYMPRPPTIPLQYTPQPVPSGSAQPMRGERNLHDANEAKATRKAEIERRCQQMIPPIPPNVLRHMDSFRAAIQISQPMTDYAWSVLEPRLIAQLPAAQQAEVDHVSRLSSLPKTTDRRRPDINSKESKEVMDREWDESQRPIRDKLSAFADDFINRDWDCGKAVTYENSPKFAVDLLVNVRRTFYADYANEDGTTGREQPKSPFEDGTDSEKPKLVLENMKWVYDNKVKPLTELFRKELFLCYGNGCEGNTKFYGFEGVIQHFGAKHTNAFSVGNVIVAWREAEWPEETPFHPDPISMKPAFQPAAGTASTGYGAYNGGYSRAGTSTPHLQAHLPQASPGPYQYGGHYNGPFAPPQMASAGLTGYDYSQPYGTPIETYQYQSMAPPVYGAHARSGYMTSPAMTSPAVAPPPAGPPPVPGLSDTLHRFDETNHRTSLFDKQVSTVIEMANDIWKHTSGIKDLPNSLRIYVLLQRVISKFHVEFNHEPNLNHFIDAFQNHEIPRALKNAPGLSCKACQDESCQYPSRQEERKTYTVLNLFSHFRSQHSSPQAFRFGNGQLPQSLDWKEDMIELPSDRIISGLIHAPGMDDEKLHMVATVFPKLFPTPLPKIGHTDSHGGVSPHQSPQKEIKESSKPNGTPGLHVDESGPSSLASPYVGSPRPPKPLDEEYDPQRPALSAQGNPSGGLADRSSSYRGTPSSEYRSRYYIESRFYVGRLRTPFEAASTANICPPQLPRDSGDDYFRPREFTEYGSSTRPYRDAGLVDDEYPQRHPVYRDPGGFYHANHEEVVIAQPRDARFSQEYRPLSRHVRYIEDNERRPTYQDAQEDASRGSSPAKEKSAADRFLDDFVPPAPSSANESTAQRTHPLEIPKPGSDLDDGSRYTPPPPNVSGPEVTSDQHRPSVPSHRVAASVNSNGSRYEEYRPPGRQIPTPDSTRGSRRPGPHRRRDRYNDHLPARYYRYMGVARDEPYSRGASMSRSQSKRYEEQRRRIDQQETPQPHAEHDLPYSRDHSVEHGLVDDSAHKARRPPRGYVSVQDRLQPHSPPRYRYAEYADEPRGHPPVFVDEYGQPIDEYEIIRVPRDSRPPRESYVAHAHRRYVGPATEQVQYVPLSYERPLPRQYESAPGYVYLEEPDHHPLPTRPDYEPDAPYEPPPEIKVEAAPPGPEAA